MPRKPRCSESGFYHVTMRGNGRQLLFTNDTERRAFLAVLSEEAAKASINVIAYCLMDNHVHLILEDQNEKLSVCMHGVAMRYAKGFNASTGHVGHVFQGRFSSAPIESDSYLLSAVRYVHDNPRHAGVASVDDYPWSSFGAYAGSALDPVGEELVSRETVWSMTDGADGFLAFSRQTDPGPYRVPIGAYPTDEERGAAVREAIGELDPLEVATLPVEQRGAALQRLWKAGLSIRQIERLCGIGRNAVARAVRQRA